MKRPFLIIALSLAAFAAQPPAAHFYYAGDVAGAQSLELNAPHIRMLSPVWIVVGAVGDVTVNVDPKVMALAAAHRFELWPVVVNRDFRPNIARFVLGDPKRVEALAAKLAAAAIRYRFHGLHLDFENMDGLDRRGYVHLAASLRQILSREGIGLSAAVSAPLYSTGGTAGRPLEWRTAQRSEAYDYGALAAHCDFLTLMSYDQYATPGAPGPIAGISWMEACLRKILESVPAEKIQLGLPLYHRRWTGRFISTGSWAEAQVAAIKARVPWNLDPLHQEPVIRFRQGGIDSTIWFEDARSLAMRLELVARYALRGFSAWRLGQEDPSVWPALFSRPNSGCQ